MAKRRANGEGSIRKCKDDRWEGRYTAGYDPETSKSESSRTFSARPKLKSRKSWPRHSRKPLV